MPLLANALLLCAGAIAGVAGHGAIVSPRSRNSVDYLVGINSPKDWPSNSECTNITGAPCHNGQADFWCAQPHCSLIPQTRHLPLPYPSFADFVAVLPLAMCNVAPFFPSYP